MNLHFRKCVGRLLCALPIFLFTSCNFSAQEDLSSDKKRFLEKFDLTYPLIDRQLDSLQVTAEEVFHFCRESKELERKTRLISAICGSQKNYLKEKDNKYWLGALYRMEDFTEKIHYLKKSNHRSFIDIGSGNGEKTYAALCLGFENSFGLEYSDSLVQLSRSFLAPFLQKKISKIYHQDALKTSPGFYGQFDFLYLYSPIKNEDTMATLFYRLMLEMKENAILLEVRMVYRESLQKISGLGIPNLQDLALTKKEGKFYYALIHRPSRRLSWFLLDKIH